MILSMEKPEQSGRHTSMRPGQAQLIKETCRRPLDLTILESLRKKINSSRHASMTLGECSGTGMKYEEVIFKAEHPRTILE